MVYLGWLIHLFLAVAAYAALALLVDSLKAVAAQAQANDTFKPLSDAVSALRAQIAGFHKAGN